MAHSGCHARSLHPQHTMPRHEPLSTTRAAPHTPHQHLIEIRCSVNTHFGHGAAMVAWRAASRVPGTTVSTLRPRDASTSCPRGPDAAAANADDDHAIPAAAAATPSVSARAASYGMAGCTGWGRADDGRGSTVPPYAAAGLGGESLLRIIMS